MSALARRSMLVLVVIALSGGAAGLQAADTIASPESVGFSADGLKALQQTMRALVDDGKLAGVTTLVARHGKVVSLDTYGVQDLATKKPVTRDTIFRLASMTKPIVGVAMMMLWEQGKWALDDPVARHIPEFERCRRGDDAEHQRQHADRRLAPGATAHSTAGVSGVGESEEVIRRRAPTTSRRTRGGRARCPIAGSLSVVRDPSRLPGGVQGDLLSRVSSITAASGGQT